MNAEQLSRIETWIAEHRQQMIADIIRLVKIPSISEPQAKETPFGKPCRDALAEMLQIGKEHGFQTRNFDDYCGCMWLDGDGSDVKESVGFWGHLDVVPVGDHWQFDPFDAFEKDGYIIGRGSQDNKGPTIATMYVALCLKELGLSLNYPIKLFFGCSEEAGMEDMAYYREHYDCPKMSIIADSGFPVCYGEKGIIEANLVSNEPLSDAVLGIKGGVASNVVPDYAELVLTRTQEIEAKLVSLSGKVDVVLEEQEIRIQASGSSAHAAFPQGSENAIQKLVDVVLSADILGESDAQSFRFLRQVNEDFYGTGLSINGEDELSGTLTCVGSMVGLNEKRQLWLHTNIRYPISGDFAVLRQSMKTACAEQAFHLEVLRHSAPNYFPKEHPAVSILTNVFQEITGRTDEPFVMGGGTYARKLPHAFAYGMGIPQDKNDHPMFLPGHGGAHGPDEALKLDSLCEAMKIFAMGLLALNEME